MGSKRIIWHLRDERRKPYLTLVAVKPKDKEVLNLGYATCHPSKDSYSKKLGVTIATGRASKGKPIYRNDLKGTQVTPDNLDSFQDYCKQRLGLKFSNYIY